MPALDAERKTVSRSEGEHSTFLLPVLFLFLSLIFNFVLSALLIFFFRKCKPLTLRIIVGIAWLIIVGFEIGKQINWCYTSLVTRQFGKINLGAFPFAICSLPYYIWPLFIFLPESRFRTIVSVLIGVYIFFPALGFQFYPGTLGQRVFINHQTMIHHGLQLCISLLIFVHEFEKFTFKDFLWSSLGMVILSLIAILLNIILTKNYDVRNMNLWELSPIEGHESIYSPYKDVLKIVPYPIYYIIYMLLLTGIGAISYFLVGGTIKFISGNNDGTEIQLEFGE